MALSALCQDIHQFCQTIYGKKQSEPFAETTVAQIIKCLVCLSLSANACGENLPFFYDVEMHCFHFLCPFLVLSIYGVIICV